MFVTSMQTYKEFNTIHVSKSSFTFHSHYSLFTEIYITFLSISYFFTMYNTLISIEFLLLFEKSNHSRNSLDQSLKILSNQILRY